MLCINYFDCKFIICEYVPIHKYLVIIHFKHVEPIPFILSTSTNITIDNISTEKIKQEIKTMIHDEFTIKLSLKNYLFAMSVKTFNYNVDVG